MKTQIGIFDASGEALVLTHTAESEALAQDFCKDEKLKAVVFLPVIDYSYEVNEVKLDRAAAVPIPGRTGKVEPAVAEKGGKKS